MTRNDPHHPRGAASAGHEPAQPAQLDLLSGAIEQTDEHEEATEHEPVAPPDPEERRPHVEHEHVEHEHEHAEHEHVERAHVRREHVEHHPHVERERPVHHEEAVGPRADRAIGCILAGAIGDAMGHPTEFVGSMRAIRDRWGAHGVQGFELYWDRDGRRFAPYTDDTQMAEAVALALLDGRAEDLDLDATMKRMATRFIEWSKHPQGGHRAPGNACMSGCSALARGTDWRKAGGPTAGGCGSVMRVHPFGIVFADDLKLAERWAVAHSRLTHNDPIALAACAAQAVGIARIFQGDDVKTVASEMVAAACRYSPKTAAMIAEAVEDAESGGDPEPTFDRLRGWAAHEAIAAAVFVFVRHPEDPRAAILEGANTPGDSDSIASIAGALVGANVGGRALPEEWVRDVERSDALRGLALRLAHR